MPGATHVIQRAQEPTDAIQPAEGEAVLWLHSAALIVAETGGPDDEYAEAVHLATEWLRRANRPGAYRILEREPYPPDAHLRVVAEGVHEPGVGSVWSAPITEDAA